MAGVSVNLATHVAIDTFGTTDTLSNIERIIGTSFADKLIGGDITNANTTVSESFEGRGGNDTIDGGAASLAAGITSLVTYERAITGVRVNLSTVLVDGNLAAGTATDGEGGIDTLLNVNRIRG